MAARADIWTGEEGVIRATLVVGKEVRWRGLLHVAVDAGIIDERVGTSCAHSNEEGVLTHQDVALCRPVRCTAILKWNTICNSVIVQAPSAVVAGDTDSPITHACGRKSCRQDRRVTEDPDGGVCARSGGGTDVVGVVACHAGLRLDRVVSPVNRSCREASRVT